MTTEDAYNDFTCRLEQIYDGREAENIADWVFENVTGLKRWERRLHQKDELVIPRQKELENYISELMQHKPVQYVLKEAWFYKMKFFVNEGVLIPRPETEELVSWVLENAMNSPHDITGPHKITLLDIGTGSGTIAIALKKALPSLTVTAVDISEKALAVAAKNAGALHARVDFFELDFLDEHHWERLGKYDIIVSNPPYIPETEKEKLAKNVTAFEPGIALFVPADDPFIFYEKIAKFSKTHLKDGGKIFVEIHEAYFLEVAGIFNEYDFTTEVREDIYGKKRMIRAI